jgi:hypothetical protein
MFRRTISASIDTLAADNYLERSSGQLTPGNTRRLRLTMTDIVS